MIFPTFQTAGNFNSKILAPHLSLVSVTMANVQFSKKTKRLDKKKSCFAWTAILSFFQWRSP
jgi:hypothetical protein